MLSSFGGFRIKACRSSKTGVVPAHGGGILALGARALADDHRCKAALVEQFHQRLITGTEHGIRKGEVLFFPTGGVLDHGEMSVEIFCAVILQRIGHAVQHGGIIRFGGIKTYLFKPQLLDKLDDKSRRIFEEIPIDRAISIEKLCALGLTVGDVMSSLTVLEINGLISTLPGNLYIRR